MDYAKAVLLAIVEGLTEFLPVSSTGHLIVAERFVRLTDDPAYNAAFIVAIQLPAIGAVVVYFWGRLWPFGKGGEHFRRTFGLWLRVAAGFLPAAVLGLLFDDLIEAYLFRPSVVAAALAVGGLLLIGLERVRRPVRFESPDTVPFWFAVGVGFAQCVAMIPGTSRSAATIIGALLLGASRPTAAEFSFFLAIPTMLGATTLKLVKNGVDFSLHEWTLLGLGSAVSFAVAYASIAFLMAYIQRHDFTVFGIYRLALAAVLVVVLATVGL